MLQEKALVGAFSVIVKTDGSFAALNFTPGTGGGAGGHPAIVAAYKYVLQFHSDDDRII